MTKKRKQEYCYNKEYWFGTGEEAQEKPSGFKFKRGTLLKVRGEHYFSNWDYNTSYQGFNPYGRSITLPPGFDGNTIALLFDYDSEFGQKRMWNETDDKYEYVETIIHTFTFLYGDQWGSVTLEAWGTTKTRNLHNDMWHKARKGRKPPKRKRKRHGGGFAFDDYEDESDALT